MRAGATPSTVRVVFATPRRGLQTALKFANPLYGLRKNFGLRRTRVRAESRVVEHDKWVSSTMSKYGGAGTPLGHQANGIRIQGFAGIDPVIAQEEVRHRTFPAPYAEAFNVLTLREKTRPIDHASNESGLHVASQQYGCTMRADQPVGGLARMSSRTMTSAAFLASSWLECGCIFAVALAIGKPSRLLAVATATHRPSPAWEASTRNRRLFSSTSVITRFLSSLYAVETGSQATQSRQADDTFNQNVGDLHDRFGGDCDRILPRSATKFGQPSDGVNTIERTRDTKHGDENCVAGRVSRMGHLQSIDRRPSCSRTSHGKALEHPVGAIRCSRTQHRTPSGRGAVSGFRSSGVSGRAASPALLLPHHPTNRFQDRLLTSSGRILPSVRFLYTRTVGPLSRLWVATGGDGAANPWCGLSDSLALRRVMAETAHTLLGQASHNGMACTGRPIRFPLGNAGVRQPGAPPPVRGRPSYARPRHAAAVLAADRIRNFLQRAHLLAAAHQRCDFLSLHGRLGRHEAAPALRA